MCAERSGHRGSPTVGVECRPAGAAACAIGLCYRSPPRRCPRGKDAAAAAAAF